MKVICFLLSIWIVFCAGRPCADRSSVCSAEKAQMASVHMPHTDQEADTDLCSPFCVCYCCAVSTALPKGFHFAIKTDILPVPPNTFICPPVRDYHNACWQPPRSC